MNSSKNPDWMTKCLFDETIYHKSSDVCGCNVIVTRCFSIYFVSFATTLSLLVKRIERNNIKPRHSLKCNVCENSAQKTAWNEMSKILASYYCVVKRRNSWWWWMCACTMAVCVCVRRKCGWTYFRTLISSSPSLFRALSLWLIDISFLQKREKSSNLLYGVRWILWMVCTWMLRECVRENICGGWRQTHTHTDGRPHGGCCARAARLCRANAHNSAECVCREGGCLCNNIIAYVGYWARSCKYKQ